MKGPLTSLKVVEFAGLGPAPLAGQLLADLGAEVVVVDRQSGPVDVTDVNRRGKSSIALNLKSPQGLEIARGLIARSDILIEGFRPGVMERLSLGPDDLDERLIYGRMTGWGQTGAWSTVAGHDINYLAMTGALHAMGAPDQPPRPPLNLVADFGGGTMFLIFGILAAVIERGISGKGQVVDAAMVDGVPALMGLIHGFLAQGAWQETRGQNWLDGASHFYRCYACADGKFIAVGALEPHFFAQLLRKIDMPEAEIDAQFETENWPQKAALLADIFKSKPRDEWAAHFEGTDACVAPVLDFQEARLHPINAERELFYQSQGVWQARTAPRFGRTDPAQPEAPTGAGYDNDRVLADLGYSSSQISDLRKAGALR